MGFLLMVALAIGGAVGLVVTCVLAAVAVAIVRRTAKRRARVGLVFGGVLVTALAGVIGGIAAWPWPEVRPGSDYDIAVRNLCLQALWCAASLGIAALGAAVATCLCPARSDAVPPAPPPA